MNKIIFVAFAFCAVAQAKPEYYGSGDGSYGAKFYYGPTEVAYEAYNAAPSYAPTYGSYGAYPASYGTYPASYGTYPASYGSYSPSYGASPAAYSSKAYSAPQPLVSYPAPASASSSSSAVESKLNPGVYAQYAVPSYSFVSVHRYNENNPADNAVAAAAAKAQEDAIRVPAYKSAGSSYKSASSSYKSAAAPSSSY